MTLLEHYEQQLKDRGMHSDPAQRWVVLRLQALYEELLEPPPAPIDGVLRNLLRRRQPQLPVGPENRSQLILLHIS
jgi:predicted ATPase